MIDSKGRLLLSGALIVSLAWISAWLAGLCIDPGSWPKRYLLFGIGYFLALSLFAAWGRLLIVELRQAERHFEALSRLSPQELNSESGLLKLPPLPSHHAWFEVATRFREHLQISAEKIQQAETTRATLEVRLKRSLNRQQQVEAVLASLPEPVLAVDHYDELLLANHSAEQLFGLNAEQVEGRVLSELVRCEQLIDLVSETRRRRVPNQRSGELQITDPRGQAHCYSITTRSIPTASENASEGAHGAVAVLRDISGLKSIQNRNAEFVSAVSHEMKTPLAGIKAYIELLVDGEADDEQTREEFLGVINSQANRLQRLIDNLLNLARIEAGVVNVSKQSQSLNELLEEALEIVRPAAQAKQIELSTDLSGMYLGVLVDRDMIMQAAINLLSNAVKYTPDGGKVVLRSRLAGDKVEFEVEDTGVGLSEEDRERVFEKFYRVKKDRDMASGTGLGLPLAKHIVEDVHGGCLSVTSTLGQGSTFRIVLPSAGQMSAG